jgi:ankyrin repeat protein
LVLLIGLTLVSLNGCSGHETPSPAIVTQSHEVIPKSPAAGAKEDVLTSFGDRNHGRELVEEDTPIRSFLKASAEGDQAALKTLIRSGVDVDSTSESGNSALLIATFFEQKDSFDFLLANGADPNLQNIHGDSPISVAANKVIGKEYWLQAILENGGNPNLCNDKVSSESAQFGFTKATPIFDALRARNASNVKLLVDAGASIDWKDNRGHSLLAMAAGIHQFDIALVLLKHGANYESKAENGMSIEEYMAQIDKNTLTPEQVEYLTEALAFIENARDTLH